MKNKLRLFLILSLSSFSFFLSPISGQKIKGAVALGINLSQVDGDEVYGFHKYGINVGPSAIMSFNKHWSVSIETLYNQKGSYQKPTSIDSASGEYRLQLDYVEVPLLVHFEDRDTWTFGAGFSWGRLINVKEYQHGVRIPSTTIDGPYKTSDWDIIADVQFRIWKGLKFDGRYAYTIVPIRTRVFDNTLLTWSRKQYNSVISFRLIYVINDDSPPRVKRKKKDRKELLIPE
ncbi:MAG: porin family protein [Bacteroidota bacterium]